MPNTVYKGKERRLLCAAVLDLQRMWVSTYFGEEAFGTRVEEIVLCAAVTLGQLEGRPLNASKLADFTGIPRATVIRKLNAMELRGMIERIHGNGFRMTAATLNSKEAKRCCDVSLSRIVALGVELSKMNT